VTDEDLKRLFDTMSKESAAAHSETRRQFEVLTETTRREIRVVAESVVAITEKLDRHDGDIRDEMRRGFAETQAMIKLFSHVEIDRRVRSIEDAVADLQARVARLEGSTH
jgi:IS30 family transposase